MSFSPWDPMDAWEGTGRPATPPFLRQVSWRLADGMRELVLREGESAAILYRGTGAEAFTVESSLVWIFNSAGVAVVDGDAGASRVVDKGQPDTVWEVYYLWDISSLPPGDYTHRLQVTGPNDTITLAGAALLWPRFSFLDRYVTRIQGWLQERETGEALQAMTLRDYRDALWVALTAYAGARPAAGLALSHTADTYPAADFETITQYAAGVAMAGPLANKAAQKDDRPAGSDLTNYRDLQTRRRQQGREMMADAKALWGQVPPSVADDYPPAFAFGAAPGGRGR